MVLALSSYKYKIKIKREGGVTRDHGSAQMFTIENVKPQVDVNAKSESTLNSTYQSNTKNEENEKRK